jgi:dipeptide/tripeptide permease
MALIDTFLAPFVLLMIIGASVLDPIIGTRNLFVMSGFLIALGLLLLTFWVKEPRLYPHKVAD